MPVSRAAVLREIETKLGRVQKFLVREKADGLLLSLVRSFAWITGGLGDSHILLNSDRGIATLLITAQGKRYVISANNEIPRLIAEDLATLGYKAEELAWYAADPLPVARRLVKGKLLSDAPLADLPVVDLAPLQVPLTESEIKKYRWVGRNSTKACVAALEQVRPGMTERQIAALISHELLQRGIRPTVVLVGSDERLYRFRHAPPTDKKVRRYTMVNVCASRWGLVAAVTRYIHFGPVPAELQRRLEAAALVNAMLQASSLPGKSADEMLGIAAQAYAESGYDGEWELHHQGGAIGYNERDWIAVPGLRATLQEGQAFAWNPTVQGAKVEDTIVVRKGKILNLTATPGWPVITLNVNGKKIASPAIRVMRARGGRGGKQ